MTPDQPRAALLTPERCARLREAFDHAVELPREARAAWIAAHAADADDRAALGLLLDATTDEGPLDRPVIERLRRFDDRDEVAPEGLVGQRIGAFRLVRLLGRGGMATVFLGERDDGEFRQLAALKLLRVGLYSAQEQRLFRRERQTLAALSHPNIAHLIDGGISEAGVPFLVLEYVDGVPITQHAQQRGLSRDARLRLFVTTCQAVAAAHRQLVVHRDLKPSNILVTAAGEVKLLDFGIAKLLDDDEAGTRSLYSPMTPEYAAPEQVQAQPITTATDVYALGIVLHELLLGQRPSAQGTLSPALRGDLRTIVGKALEPEPARRYESAAALAEDIERLLASQPVQAHPPSRWYRTRTFVRRHRGGVALTLVFAIGVLASLAVAVWQARAARHEAANARAEAQRATVSRQFIEDLFQPVQDQLAEERMPSLRELVERGAQQIDTQADLGEAQRIDLLLMFARLNAQLAERDAGLALARRAHEEAVRTQPADGALRIAATQTLARALMAADDFAAATPLLREVERWQATHMADYGDRIDLLADLSAVENEAGHPDAALAYAERDLALRVETHGPDSVEAGSGHNNVGYVLEAMGRLDEAIAEYRKTWEIDDRRLDPGSLQRAFPIGNLAQAMFNAGRLSEARPLFARTQALYADVALEQPPRALLGQLSMLAYTEFGLGDLDGAARAVEAHAGWVAKTPPSNIDHAMVGRLRAKLALERGDLGAAVAQLDALPASIAILPEPRRTLSSGYRDMLRAEIAMLQGEDAAAVALANAAPAAIGERFYPLHVVPQVRALQALACERAPHDECPDDAFARAAEMIANPPYRDHPALLSAGTWLARIELSRGDARTALARLDALVTGARAHDVDATGPRYAQALAWRAVALAAGGDCAGARAAMRPGEIDDSHVFVAEAARALAAACTNRR